MQFQITPGHDVGDLCPSCRCPSLLVNQVTTAWPPSYGGIGVQGYRIGGGESVERVRACPKCLLEWHTTSGPTPGAAEILKAVHTAHQGTSVNSPYGGGPSLTTWVSNGSNVVSMNSAVIAQANLTIFPADAPLPPPEPEGVLPELPAVLGSVIGYRAWGVCDRTMLLTGTSTYPKEPWASGVNEAICSVADHPAPDPGCHCGLYALARFNSDNPWWGAGHILGAVEAWSDPDEENRDRFFLHPDPGFRSQYAKIVLLATDDSFSRAKNDFVRKVLAPTYGADVVRREHLEDAAKEHGRLVPEELIELAQADASERKSKQKTLAHRLKARRAEIGQSAGYVAPPAWLWNDDERQKKVRKELALEQIDATLRRFIP